MKKKKTRNERQFERELREAIRLSRLESSSNAKSAENEKTDNIKSNDDDDVSKKSKKDFIKENSDDKSANDINEEKISDDNEQMSDHNSENQNNESPQKQKELPVPLVSKQNDQENEKQAKDETNNPLFVEFEIKAPTPNLNSPRIFLSKKSSNHQLPSSVNSLYSSTTSSTSSDDDDKTSLINQQQRKLPNISAIKPLTTSKVENENKDDGYFAPEEEKDSFDYNDVEVDEIEKDKRNLAASTTQNLNSQQHILNLQRLIYLNSINPNHPISNSSQQNQTKNYASNVQNKFDTSKINDPKIVSAFSYLDKYKEEKKKQKETKKEEKKKKIDLAHDGIPFFSYDPSKEDERAQISFPTEPFKPSSKTMNMLFGDEFNEDEQNFGDYGFRNDFSLQTEEENDFQINIKSSQNFNQQQDSLNSLSFKIAPYLQEKNQKQDIENEQSVENNSNENDLYSKLSNDENDDDFNEDEKLIKNKGSSRYFQQNDEFDSDNDYDFEVSEVKNDPFKNKESLDYSALKKPKQVQLNVAEFESVPFHPMNSDDFFSLMMNSMTYDEKKISK